MQETIKKLADLENQIQKIPSDSLLRINLRSEYFHLYDELEKSLPHFHRCEIDEMILAEVYKSIL